MTEKSGMRSVRLTLSPFVKIVLVVIAIALSVIAIKGLLSPMPLYAQSGSSTTDVNIKSIGGSAIYGSIPIEIKGSGVRISEFPYSGLKVVVKDN
ncbi:hypothetical protein GX441_02895 [bacterium]|nr:hypothetical protein [bacterium]